MWEAEIGRTKVPEQPKQKQFIRDPISTEKKRGHGGAYNPNCRKSKIG
jgi:hypothetical protein